MLGLYFMAKLDTTAAVAVAAVLFLFLLGNAGGCSVSSQSELSDQDLSRCFTEVFHNELLPHVREGIPQLGIISIDPAMIPKMDFTILNTPFARATLHTENVLMVGCANMTRSDILVNSANEEITGLIGFSSVEFEPAKVRVEGHVFGMPLRWFFNDNGRLVGRMDGVLVNATFGLRNTLDELFKLHRFDYDASNFVTRSQGFLRSAWMENMANLALTRFSRQIFQGIWKPGFHDACEGIIKAYMDTNLWKVVVGDFL